MLVLIAATVIEIMSILNIIFRTCCHSHVPLSFLFLSLVATIDIDEVFNFSGVTTHTLSLLPSGRMVGMVVTNQRKVIDCWSCALMVDLLGIERNQRQ